MFWYVIPFGKSFDEFWFTYEIPKNFEKGIKIGQIVKIFLWEKETFWVIYEIFENIPEKIEKSTLCFNPNLINFIFTQVYSGLA